VASRWIALLWNVGSPRLPLLPARWPHIVSWVRCVTNHIFIVCSLYLLPGEKKKLQLSARLHQVWYTTSGSSPEGNWTRTISVAPVLRGPSDYSRIQQQGRKHVHCTRDRYVTMETRCVAVVSWDSQLSWKKKKPHFRWYFWKSVCALNFSKQRSGVTVHLRDHFCHSFSLSSFCLIINAVWPFLSLPETLKNSLRLSIENNNQIR
jgi:hypothetical protein